MRIALVMPASTVAPEGDDRPLSYQGAWRGQGHYTQNWCSVLEADHWTGNVLPDDPAVILALETYDALLINQSSNMYRITVQLAEQLEHCKVCALQDGSVDDLTMLVPSKRLEFMEAARAAACYLTFQEWSMDWFRLWTDRPVFYVGVPSSWHLMTPMRLPIEQHEPYITIGTLLGIGGADRNAITGVGVALRAIPGVRITAAALHHPHVPPELHEAQYRLVADFFPSVELHGWMCQTTYWEHMAKARLALHLDVRYPWGRIALDGAALGTPVVGTPNNGTQEHCWPALSVHPFRDVMDTVELIRRLWEDDEFWQEQVDYAQTVLPNYTDGHHKALMLNALTEIGAGQ